MTFYWWSHWFWITLLGIVLLLSTTVYTYPSQEIILENNQNSKVAKTVTKLYQTGTAIKWGTTDSTTTQSMDLIPDGLVKEEEEYKTEKSASSKEIEDIEELKEDERNELQNKNINFAEKRRSKGFEFKRSAENKEIIIHENLELPKNVSQESAIKINKKPTVTMTEDDSLGTKTRNEDMPIVNNHDNFSANISNLSTNTTTEKILTNSTIEPIINKSPPSAPSAPLIDAEPQQSAAEWFKTIVAQLPAPVSQQNLDEISSNLVTSSSSSQKIPFTLENVNREDELRRAENEHRTRKSKVLSAEYKHINRYINYSSESKSLLARSASASPNDFDNDSESNISSEALAIQRTYFLDAGAISAICFTVFGVCCTVGTIGIVLYRRRYLNKPQTLSEPDSSVYIDDSTMRVSDNSDEMYSLDNDSFLNSLEAMTIQNYWTDTVKHTKL